MSLKPYPTYTTVGADWLSELPAGWFPRPLKHIARSMAGGTPDSNSQVFWTDDGGTPWVSIGDMSSRDLVSDTARQLTTLGLAEKSLTVGPSGTVLFAMYASVGEVSMLGVPAAWNQAILGFNIDAGVAMQKFVFYALKALSGWLPSLYRSNTQNNLNAEQVRNLQMPIPTMPEQADIVDFLDLETGEIDAFIADQEELIRLLSERRAATVTQAVTQGLESNRPMKYSGVEWLGEVPIGWRIQKLWTLFAREKNVEHPDEMMLSVFRDYGVVPKDSRDNFNKTAENRNIYQLVEPGWLVSNRMKAWQGSVGISPYRGIVSGHYICFRPTHSEDDDYLNRLFRSEPYATGYRSISRGVRIGQAEIDNDEYRLMPVLLPPVDEQRRIASYLEAETAEIDAAITDAMEAIALSKERRVAVIWAAVTGKIDVRNRATTEQVTIQGEPVGVA